MNTLLALIFCTFICLVACSHSTNAAYNKIRKSVAFDTSTKWDCFYRTTTPVKGLNPAIWRHDQFGNLLMAGLNYNCTGCLCYTFDHRFPVSNIGNTEITYDLTRYMSSINNCQALSFRTNALKGSNEDADIQSFIKNFGCDNETMKLFEDNDYMGARAVQKYLLSEERTEQIYAFYESYVGGLNYLDPKVTGQSRSKYFELLTKKSEFNAKKIAALIE